MFQTIIISDVVEPQWHRAFFAIGFVVVFFKYTGDDQAQQVYFLLSGNGPKEQIKSNQARDTCAIF